MRNRLFAALLPLCLLLSACGGEKDPSGGLLESASGLPEETVLVTVGGREVAAWQYLYWLAFTCDQLQARYDGAGLELDWAAPLEGGTLADYAKDQALADAALYAVVENWAEQYGAVLGEADSGALAEAWTEKTASYGGEEQYLAALGNLGLNRARAEALSRVGQLYGKLYELYGADDGPLTPDPVDLAAFAREQGWLTVDRALIPIGADRSEAQAKAAEIFSRLNQAPDKAEAFPALAAEGDDSAGPRTFLAGDGTLPAALEEAAAALEPGQCSGILESGEGFSILLRCETNPQDVREEYFDYILQEAAKNAQVELTEAYRALDAAAFATERIAFAILPFCRKSGQGPGGPGGKWLNLGSYPYLSVRLTKNGRILSKI